MASSKRGSAERRRGGAARAGSGKAPELFTLGGVRLVRQNVDETSKLGPKHLALLVYLFHEARPMHPSEVTDLLGRGREQEKEMEGLTRAVTWLRENVPGLDIRLTGETVESLGGVTLDTRQVDAAIDGGDPGHVEELYAGEFLEGFESGAPAFDEWAQKERGRLKRAWNHAMLSAAREAERRRKWELAADWWAVLVARAPMRAEAVAGLLGALADSRQEEEAARAYAEYEKRLKESGIAQPADPVREVISKHKLLQDVVAGRIKAPPEPPGAAKPAPQTEPASAAEPLESEQLVPDLDIEPTPAPPKPPPSAPAPSAPPAPPKPPPKPEVGAVPGFEAGAPPPMRGEKPAEADESPAPKEAWDEIVDIASAEEFEIDITPAPKVTPPPMPRPPGIGGASKDSGAEAAPPKPKPTPTPAPRRPKMQDDEALKQARQAAKEFRDIEYGIVRHEVTSVRKQWGPTLQKWWDELAPLRAKAAELGVAALQAAAAALVLGLQLAGRGLRVLGLKAGASLTAMGGRVKVRRQRAAEARARRAEVKSEQRAQRAVDRGAQKEAKQAEKGARKEAKQAEREAKKEAKQAEREADRAAKRAEKEAAQAVLEAPPESELVEAPPWDEEPEVAPWDEEPLDTPSVRRPGFGRQVEFEPPAEEYAAPMEDAGAAIDFVAPTGEVPLVEVTPARPRRRRRPIGPLLLRFRYVPVVLALAGLAVVFGPKLVGMIRGLTEDLPSQLPDVQAPSLPRVTLPRVTIRTPAFVETGVSRIAEMFSGSLLEEPGQWLLLADVEIEGADGEGAAATADGATAATLGLALEADLNQARYYNVVPHERALLARRTATGSRSEALPLAEALSLAGSAGFTAILGGRVSRYESVDSVVLQVFNPAGDTLYGVAAEVSEESSTLETLAGLARTVRRRLGEPRDEIAASLPARQVLSTSASALDAFAQARLHYYAGRYSQAITAARRAVARDSTFSLAYRLLAQAYAQSGQRTSARSMLETAWRFSERLTQRERLRLLADRHAWDGRLSDAILTYDDLFHDYRDDVGALKSQALLQRMIGVRGGGEGNLRVAYMIDPYDWPPLSRIARYLGYRGALPDVDSLVAAVREQPE
jgi:DNA-binding SARP family transcriptional activator